MGAHDCNLRGQSDSCRCAALRRHVLKAAPHRRLAHLRLQSVLHPVAAHAAAVRNVHGALRNFRKSSAAETKKFVCCPHNTRTISGKTFFRCPWSNTFQSVIPIDGATLETCMTDEKEAQSAFGSDGRNLADSGRDVAQRHILAMECARKIELDLNAALEGYVESYYTSAFVTEVRAAQNSSAPGSETSACPSSFSACASAFAQIVTHSTENSAEMVDVVVVTKCTHKAVLLSPSSLLTWTVKCLQTTLYFGRPFTSFICIFRRRSVL